VNLFGSSQWNSGSETIIFKLEDYSITFSWRNLSRVYHLFHGIKIQIIEINTETNVNIIDKRE